MIREIKVTARAIDGKKARTVWKYEINIGITQIVMPVGAEILTVKSQGKKIMLWALVNPSSNIAKEIKVIEIFGTGRIFEHRTTSHPKRYVCTFEHLAGEMYHVFESYEEAVKFINRDNHG